jgi:hypothetical protein
MPGLRLIKTAGYNAVNFSYSFGVDVAETDTGSQPPQAERIAFTVQDDTAVAINDLQ